jgi:hypothetical protein
MKRPLPCPSCGVAQLAHPNKTREDYVIGVTPSCFSTPGIAFTYSCACSPKKQLSLSRQAYFAIPDLDRDALVS